MNFEVELISVTFLLKHTHTFIEKKEKNRRSINIGGVPATRKKELRDVLEVRTIASGSHILQYIYIYIVIYI